MATTGKTAYKTSKIRDVAAKPTEYKQKNNRPTIKNLTGKNQFDRGETALRTTCDTRQQSR